MAGLADRPPDWMNPYESPSQEDVVRFLHSKSRICPSRDGIKPAKIDSSDAE